MITDPDVYPVSLVPVEELHFLIAVIEDGHLKFDASSATQEGEFSYKFKLQDKNGEEGPVIEFKFQMVIIK